MPSSTSPRRQPKTEAEWGELQAKTLALAESANLLMMPGRARDQDRWMQDAKLMLDAGTAAYRAARRKDLAALDALSDQLYESCTSCHQHYRPNYGRRPRRRQRAHPPSLPHPPHLPHLPHLPRNSRAAGSCAPPRTCAPTAPWRAIRGGSIRWDRSSSRAASCYLQIMSSDTPAFPAGSTSTGEQMKATLLSSYIAYSGPCTINEAEGSVTLKVEAAWRPDYVGTEQKRFFRFENGTLLFGPAVGSIRAGDRDAHAAADARPRPVSG